MSATAPSATAGPALPARSARQGAFREVGTVRHASIHAQRYRLAGTGKVLGMVDLDEGSFDGMLSVGGDLTADRIESDGSLEVDGEVAVRESLTARGTLKVGGRLSAGSLTFNGLGRVAKDVRVDTMLTYHGTLEANGDVSCGLFSPDGRFAILGSLTAKEVAGQFDGESHVDTIEASSVTLRPKAFVRLPVDIPPLRPKGTLTVARIEATSVDLEGVSVHYLKAATIALGRNCHVAQVEGRVVRRDRSSYVGFESRSPPPPGLSH